MLRRYCFRNVIRINGLHHMGFRRQHELLLLVGQRGEEARSLIQDGFNMPAYR